MSQLELIPSTPATEEPRPGSRAARMRQPLAKEALKQLAEQHGVCVRPLALRRIDTVTGLTEVVEVPCGATLAVKCKPCAERGRRLRIQQIREGWHLADEPAVQPDRPGEDALALVRVRAHLEFEREALNYQPMHPDQRAAQIADVDAAIAELDEALAETSLRGHLTPKDRDERPRRKRSTRRRQDSPDLPRLPVDPRTVGRAYSGRSGKTHRPSMLVTLTLGSHGPVHSHIRRGAYVAPCECGQRHGPHDDLLGTPVDPTSYDYRRAALDAIHFARVLDRWWQNVRRAAGWNVQYAGAVELQRRLAPQVRRGRARSVGRPSSVGCFPLFRQSTGRSSAPPPGRDCAGVSAPAWPGPPSTWIRGSCGSSRWRSRHTPGSCFGRTRRAGRDCGRCRCRGSWRTRCASGAGRPTRTGGR
ncbi:hypothetical protein GA0074694_1797 [Micromonospora inyonensis]|uniref:Uncharacterized protein n=1 Tax=Micromonospora inyonensis TaxID=47866 RepID=A0A1C6RII5_9ACTN|nr:hypothetical protein GA0074694_1797 [Micromonospora inyonensis]